MPFVLPNEARKKRLTEIQKWLSEHKQDGGAGPVGRAVSLMLEEDSFLRHVAEHPELKSGAKSEDDLTRFSWAYLYHLLYGRDHVAAAMVLWDRETFCAEPECVQMIWQALISKRMICVIGGGGLGKCLGKDVMVLMHDGSTKPAQTIVAGDVLMGDDGKPRNVLSAHKGYGPMYRIVPERGEAWTCNDEHILSLRASYDKKAGNGSVIAARSKGSVVDVPLKEYINWASNRKAQFLSFHVGVNFPEAPLPYDPYIYGAWLGDGGWDSPAIFKPIGPITERWCEYFTSLGMRIHVGNEDTNCPMFAARTVQQGDPNPFTRFIRTSVKDKEKFIRQDYLVNSRENRMKLLAGLLDTDGYVNNTAFEISSKWEGLARQIVWLARSLGFAATVTPRIKTIKSIGFSGTYWVVYISGYGLDELPTLQKKTAKNITVKSMTNTAFKVEPIGDDFFYGFVIDGNRRFLLGDFTVTHNTYSPSAFFLLEYTLDPEWTRIQLASATAEHLLGNMFADMIRLHSGASMTLPGKQDTESISLEKKRAQGIFTLTLPGGANGKSKIKGAHTKPRPAHPMFGRRSRVFALVDESQEVPQNIFQEIPNRFSTVVGDDVDHLKFLISANPKDLFSEFGRCAKPKGGWETITRAHRQWESERGWWVISLDQTHHENYLARRAVFPGFATYDGVQARLRDCDGDEEDPRMYTYVYGKFPPQGTTFACIKQRHLLAAEGEWIFESVPYGIAGGDPAFVSDRPGFATGRCGRAIGWWDYAGNKHMLPEPMMAIQVDLVTSLPHGDSQDVADSYLERLKDLDVAPQFFGMDQTGTGRGCADIVRRQWVQKIGALPEGAQVAGIVGIEYAGSPSMVKIAAEDTQLPKAMFDRVATEMWYAAAKLFELGVIRIGKGVDLEVLSELAARKGDMQPGLGRKLTIETKDAYKARTKGRSPDLADAMLCMTHAARMSVPGLAPKAKDTVAPKPEVETPGWNGFGVHFAGADFKDMEVVEIENLMRD